MDKLTVVRGCPNLSYLNTCERAMSLLNIGLSALALRMDPNTDDWLLEEVLAGSSSMKAVRKAIEEYDAAVPAALETLKRRQSKQGDVAVFDIDNEHENVTEDCSVHNIITDNDNVHMNNSDNGNNDKNNTNDGLHIGDDFSLGRKVRCFLDFQGWFEGVIDGIRTNSVDGQKVYSVRFCCKDAKGKNVYYSKETSFESLDSDRTAAMIPIGQVGFKFVKQFSGGGYFNGIVKRICGGTRKMCQCDFNDDATHTYSLKQLESYSKIQVPFNDDTILGSDSDSVDSDNKSEESECEEENHDDDTDSENESSDDGKPSMNGKYFQKLVLIPSGMSTSQRLNEL